MNEIEEAKKIINSEIEGLKNLSNNIDEKFCEVIKIIRGINGSLIITGVGKSGIIGKKIAATMASIGISSYFMHPTDALHGDLGAMSEKDILMLISNSGNTDELISLINPIKDKGIKTILISGNPDSELVHSCDYFLNIGKCVEADPNDIMPTTSTTVTMALGDALAIVSQYEILTPESFLKNHPAGSIAKKIKDVKILKY